MRVFLLNHVANSRVVPAILGAPFIRAYDAADDDIEFKGPAGGRVLVRPAGYSEFHVIEGHNPLMGNDVEACVQEMAENRVSFEVVRVSDDCEVQAFSFLDQSHYVPTTKCLAQLTSRPGISLSDLWSFQANWMDLRRFEALMHRGYRDMWVRFSDIERRAFSDELLEFATKTPFQRGLYLPLECRTLSATTQCVAHLIEQVADVFVADVYCCASELDAVAEFELANVSGESVFRGKVLSAGG